MDDVVAVVTDLFFQSRIDAAARAAGRQVRYLSSAQGLGAADWSVALVDLDAQADVETLIRALRANGHGSVVAFGPHLDTVRMKAARAAGATRVLAKSKFVTELPKLMNDQQGKIDGQYSELRRFGSRIEELGRLLQDPTSMARLYFAPDPHMQEAESHGNAVILNSDDYLPYLAVDILRAEIDRLRALAPPSRPGASSTATE